MPKAYFTIGIAASGKTTWAHQQKGCIVLDSDQLRLELYGSETDQRDPHKVFDLMYKRGRNFLIEGKDVVFCSTNLGIKYRIHAIHQLNNIPNITFHAVVFNTPLNICRENNKARKRQVPDWLFEKQIKQLHLPVVAEGWDSIEVINQYDSFNDTCYNIIEKVTNFGSQKNYHHSLSLIEHCNKAYSLANQMNLSTELKKAAQLHDFGKAYTATYWSGQKDDGQMHYPNHAEYGAYLALNMNCGIEIATLVNYHMIPYMNEKAQETWRKRLGEDLWNKLLILHQIDEEAH